MVRPKGCFVCGQLGHLAEKCEYTERRCFNCLEAGHESSACEAPRTSETKQCYGCGGRGHIRADCPAPQERGAQACYTCGEQGHISKACPTNTAAAGSVAAASVSAPKDAAGSAPPVPCANCKRTNHMTQDCRAPEGGRAPRKRKPRVQKCHTCREAGHIAKDCPNQPTMAEAPGTNADAALTA